MNPDTRWTYRVVRFKSSKFFKLHPDPEEIADQLNQLGRERLGTGARGRRLRCTLTGVLFQKAGMTPRPRHGSRPCIAN